MIPVTVAVPEYKLTFFKELLNSLNFKEIEFTNQADIDIPEEHKKLVLERIKNAKTENWLRWDEVQNSFNFD